MIKMNTMTKGENPTEEQMQGLDIEKQQLLIQENQAYKTLMNMQNESYFRGELLENVLLLQKTLLQINDTLIDMNKINIGKD